MELQPNSPAYKETLPKWLTDAGFHLIFWMGYLLYDTVSFGSILGDFWISFFRSCLHGIILAAMVYTNLRFIYPYLFNKRKIISYLTISIVFGVFIFLIRVQLDIYISEQTFEQAGWGYTEERRDLVLRNLINIGSYTNFQKSNIDLPEHIAQQIEHAGFENPEKLREFLLIDFIKDRVLEEKPYRKFREYAWFYLIGMLLGTGIVYGMFWILRLMLDGYSKHENEQLYFRAENLRLRTQLNQHFLFNALGSIFHRFQTTQDEQGQELTQNLKWMIQYAIEKCEKNQFVSLQEEMEFVHKYLFFHAYLPGTVTISPLEEAHQSIGLMPMLLNPILENAIKHGNLNQQEGFIELKIHITSTAIRFTITNSISRELPFSHQPFISSFGIGLSNLRKRLELFYKHTDGYLFTYGKNEATRTFVVELEVPILDQQMAGDT